MRRLRSSVLMSLVNVVFSPEASVQASAQDEQGQLRLARMSDQRGQVRCERLGPRS